MEDHHSQRSAQVALSPHAPHIKQKAEEGRESNHARYRSETVIKERPHIATNGYSTVRGGGEGSTKKLPNIKFTTPSASKDTKAMFSNEPRESFRTIVDRALDQAKTDKIYDNQNSSFRNYYKALRSHQNQTTLDAGSLPKLNLKVHGHHHQHSVLSGAPYPSTTDRKLPLDGGFRIPTPLLCKRYHKVFNTNANNSPRDKADNLSSIPSLRRFDGQTYKQETCNRAAYMWNQWNYRDDKIVSATKHRVRDQVQVLKEEHRIQKYQEELMSIQRKRNLIETYYRDYNVRLPHNFNQQRCSTNHLHMKLASIYHRDRANKAAIRIQTWFREFQKRQLKSRRYWYMLRGIFKFKYSLRKFRDRMEKRMRDFESLVTRSAVKIQKCFRGYMVRKQHGKTLAMKRIERNYKQFYDKRLELLEAAQCKIAYVWRMNRIKIKLARKKREKEEAAKKKAMGKDKYKYYHLRGSNASQTPSNKLQSQNSLVKGRQTIVQRQGSTSTNQGGSPVAGQNKLASSVKKVQVGQQINKILSPPTLVSTNSTPPVPKTSEKPLMNLIPTALIQVNTNPQNGAHQNNRDLTVLSDSDSLTADSQFKLKTENADSVANLKISNQIGEELSIDEQSSGDERQLAENESFALINGAKEVIHKVSSKQALQKQQKTSSQGSDPANQSADGKVTMPKSFRSSSGFGGMVDKTLAGTASTDATGQ